MTEKAYFSILSGAVAETKKIPPDKMEQIPGIIRDSFSRVNRHLPREKELEFEIIRMDEFLARSETPRFALHAALMVCSYFRYHSYHELGIRADLRISMGIGPIEFQQKDIRESDGTAYRLAAAGMEQMKRNQRLVINSTDENLNSELAVATGFMDILIHDWSDEQAEALYYSLTGMNQVDISKRLDISQPAVNRRLKAAHWDATERFIKRYEHLLK